MSALTLTHLSKHAAAKLLLPDAERIAHIRKARWIGYGRAHELLSKLKELLAYPPQPRMPNMLIVGETNNGKTMLVGRFRELHPADENPGGPAVRIPVLYIQTPPGPDERGIYNAILNRLFEPYGRSEATDAKRDRVVAILRRVGLGMLMIDEVQHLLAGSPVKQRNCLNTLKYLGNELCVPIVAIGTAEAALAVQTDPQLANRFKPEPLLRWERGEELDRLLKSFERVIPLRQPSRLAAEPMAAHILQVSSGTIGEMSSLLNEAAIHAIRTGVERITPEVIAACGYVPPNHRKRAAISL